MRSSQTRSAAEIDRMANAEVRTVRRGRFRDAWKWANAQAASTAPAARSTPLLPRESDASPDTFIRSENLAIARLRLPVSLEGDSRAPAAEHQRLRRDGGGRPLGILSAVGRAKARIRSPRSLSLPAISSRWGLAVPPTSRRNATGSSSSVNAGAGPPPLDALPRPLMSVIW
jgi:hypothetical protein